MRIPQDVALLIFDDFKLADVCDPALTVVAQPVAEIGKTAAQLLLSRLRGDGPIGAQEIALQPQLIIRSSV